jgi:predicted TIM-barrel enzyme
MERKESVKTGSSSYITILKDSFDVEAVGGTSFVVGASLEVGGQLASSGVVNYPRVVFANGIWRQEIGSAG